MDRTATDNAKQRLTEGLRNHGAHLSLEDAVADFPHRLMNQKPPYVPYSFWHQLEHIRIAQEDLLLYAAEPQHRSPSWPDGYWPSGEAEADRATWDTTISAIQCDRERFIELISDPERDIFAPVKHMEGRTVFRTALLAIDHTAYHLGEFVMGRQMLGHWRSDLTR